MSSYIHKVYNEAIGINSLDTRSSISILLNWGECPTRTGALGSRNTHFSPKLEFITRNKGLTDAMFQAVIEWSAQRTVVDEIDYKAAENDWRRSEAVNMDHSAGRQQEMSRPWTSLTR